MVWFTMRTMQTVRKHARGSSLAEPWPRHFPISPQGSFRRRPLEKPHKYRGVRGVVAKITRSTEWIVVRSISF
jgi:hypothetical protein